MRILTVGHSTRDLGEFTHLLEAHGVEHLVDIRRYPSSKRFPQFDHSNLEPVLNSLCIQYTHLIELGGRRRPLPMDSNLGWEHESFRGYADYMQTRGFAGGLDSLLGIAENQRTAIMCSEAVWWRCHRRLITDALLARDVEVEHIVNLGDPKKAEMTSFAVVYDTLVTYPKTVAA